MKAREQRSLATALVEGLGRASAGTGGVPACRMHQRVERFGLGKI